MLPFRLSQLGLGARCGIFAVLMVLFLGLIASTAHLSGHHQNRDEQPGLGYQDLVGVYHGIRTRAPLVIALERGHPETLPAPQRSLLLAWLASDDLAEGYDSLDLGDDAPAEILDGQCLDCHSPNATKGGGIGATIPLAYFDEVKKQAVSRDVAPTDPGVLLASLHTHALGMGTLSLVLILLALATRFSARLVGFLATTCGLGLCADLGSWLLAREHPSLVRAIAVGGAVWILSAATLALLVGLELVRPAASSRSRR
jgi:hypothetical protein